VITIGGRTELGREVVSSMHEFRHEIFVSRLRWSLPMRDGIECDQYDNEHTVYFVVSDDEANITACARLLPTTVPYMLAEIFPQLLGEHPVPHDPAVWELSRFATSIRKSGAGRVLSLSQPTLDLLESVLEFARRNDIERLALVTSVAIERLLLRAGFNVHRVAAPASTTEGLVVALYIEVNAAQVSSAQDTCNALCSASTPIPQ
jgi:acyl homoserine lactone synthase